MKYRELTYIVKVIRTHVNSKNTFSGKLTSKPTIADVLDKGSGAVILLDGEFHSLYDEMCLFQIHLSSSLPRKVSSLAVLMKVNLQPLSAGIEIME